MQLGCGLLRRMHDVQVKLPRPSNKSCCVVKEAQLLFHQLVAVVMITGHQGVVVPTGKGLQADCHLAQRRWQTAAAWQQW